MGVSSNGLVYLQYSHHTRGIPVRASAMFGVIRLAVIFCTTPAYTFEFALTLEMKERRNKDGRGILSALLDSGSFPHSTIMDPFIRGLCLSSHGYFLT